ncbi:19835_t:CDS:2, partial [Racocetra fulgida]
MHLHKLYHRLETNTNVYPEIEKVCKFTTGLRTELQIAVRSFGENTWDRVVNRAKTCELTHYGAAMYITSNLNNNIVTPTPTSSNSVEIIMEALNKSSVNTEGPDASQDNTNPSMIYLKEEDKNNINEAYVEKRRKVVEENETPEVQNIVVNNPQAENSKTPKAKKKRNPLQGPRFYKPTIGKDVSKYSIVENLQQIKANISIAQLAAENPKYLRELITTNIILDSSSAVNIISNHFLKRIGLKITKPLTTLMLIVNGEKRRPLGEVENLPIKIVSIEFRHITGIPRVEAISKGKIKEECSDESESEYESSSKSDESTEYKDEQLEERIYTLNLWQEIEKENLKQMCLYCHTKTNEEWNEIQEILPTFYEYKIEDSFDPSTKLNVGELDEKQQEEFYDLVNEYIDIFAQNDSDLGKTNEIQHEIE